MESSLKHISLRIDVLFSSLEFDPIYIDNDNNDFYTSLFYILLDG